MLSRIYKRGVNKIKTNTVIKILTRYKKGLALMEQEALSKASADAEHYRTDRLALEQAIKIIERSNTES